MISGTQWAAIQDAVNRVCNRESDYEPIKDKGGDQLALVQRVAGSHIRITLRSTPYLDLEPEEN